MEGHHTGSAPASTWGCVDVPAGPGVGWDIPGAAWTSVGGEREMGGREVGIWVCHPLSIRAFPWMGQNEPGHDPSTTQRDKEPPESRGGGRWPLEWPSLPRDALPGHPTAPPWTALSMRDLALRSRTGRDGLKMIPPRDQKAALGTEGRGWRWV